MMCFWLAWFVRPHIRWVAEFVDDDRSDSLCPPTSVARSSLSARTNSSYEMVPLRSSSTNSATHRMCSDGLLMPRRRIADSNSP